MQILHTSDHDAGKNHTISFTHNHHAAINTRAYDRDPRRLGSQPLCGGGRRDAGGAHCGRRRAHRPLSRLTPAEAPCGPLHGRGDEHCGPHHAAALREQVRLAHDGCDDPVGAARHSARAPLHARLDDLGQGSLRLRGGHGGHLALRGVRAAHAGEGRHARPAHRHHVRQRRHGRHGLSRPPLRHDAGDGELDRRALLHGHAGPL